MFMVLVGNLVPAGTTLVTPVSSGASSLEKRGLLWKGSFWYHFSA